MCPMKALTSVLLGLSLFGQGAAIADGSIHGRVVDSEGAIIARATIRVLDEANRSTIQTLHSDENGRFDAEVTGAEHYLLVVSSPGFSDELISVGDPRSGSSTVHTVRLHFEGCDAPGVNCDIVSSEPIPPEPSPIVSQAHFMLGLTDAIDLEKSALVSSTSNTADLQLTERGGLYITPLNQARFSNSCGLNSTRDRAKNKTAPFRIDGLGPRSEICVKTNKGRVSKVFVTREVHPGDKEIEIYVVTRSR